MALTSMPSVDFITILTAAATLSECWYWSYSMSSELLSDILDYGVGRSSKRQNFCWSVEVWTINSGRLITNFTILSTYCPGKPCVIGTQLYWRVSWVSSGTSSRPHSSLLLLYCLRRSFKLSLLFVNDSLLTFRHFRTTGQFSPNFGLLIQSLIFAYCRIVFTDTDR